jgi:hypothetical protein
MMTRRMMEPVAPTKVTRNFPITKECIGLKFNSHFNPSTQESSFDTERGKVVIQWYDGFAFEYWERTKQRYRITGRDYKQMRDRYYPTPTQLQHAMLDAYLKEANHCGGKLYFIKQFAHGVLDTPNCASTVNFDCPLTNISRSYVKHTHADLNISQQEAYIWHRIAYLCDEHYDDCDYSGIHDPMPCNSPEQLLKRRAKELRSDGYHEVADSLEESIDSVVYDYQLSAMKQIWEILQSTDANEHKSAPEELEKAFISYWLRNNMHDIVIELINECVKNGKPTGIFFSKISVDDSPMLIT